MRPTQTQVSAFEQNQVANIPNVGVQVAASPVQFAQDDARFKQLDILQNQLNTFNQGQMANAKLEDKLNQTAAERKAVVDAAQNPLGKPTADDSAYYYQARMKLFGKNAALDIAAAADQEAKRIMEHPELLKETDVSTHIHNFIQEQYKGLSDPTAIEQMAPILDKTRQDLTSKLSEAKVNALKEEAKTASWELVYKSYQQSGATPQSVLSNWPELVKVVGEKDAIAFHLAAINEKMAEAKTSTEAESWLNVMKTALPGTSVTLSAIGGPEASSKQAQLVKYVSTMKQAEAHAAEQLRKEQEAAFQKQQKLTWSKNTARLDMSLQEAKTPEAIGALIANFKHGADSGGFDPEQVDIYKLKLARRQAEILQETGLVARKQAAMGYQLNEDDGKKVAEQSASLLFQNAGNMGGEEIKKMVQHDLEMIAHASPQSAPTYVSALFKGMSSTGMRYGADGNMEIPQSLRLQMEAYPVLRMDKSTMKGMTQDDIIFAEAYYSAKTDQGMNDTQALLAAQKVASTGRVPLKEDDRSSVLKDIMGESDVIRSDVGTFGLPWKWDGKPVEFKFSVPGLSSHVNEESKASVEDYMRMRLETIAVPPGMSKDGIKALLIEDYHKNFLAVDGLGLNLGNGSTIFVGGPNAVPVDRKKLERGLDYFIEGVKEIRGGTVSIYPYGYQGNHIVRITNANGEKEEMMLNVSDLAKLSEDVTDAYVKHQAKMAMGSGSELFAWLHTKSNSTLNAASSVAATVTDTVTGKKTTQLYDDPVQRAALNSEVAAKVASARAGANIRPTRTADGGNTTVNAPVKEALFDALNIQFEPGPRRPVK